MSEQFKNTVWDTVDGLRPLVTPQASVPVEGLIIGIGAQKSGITWLVPVLADHPQVHARKKEVHYWDVIRYPYVAWDSATN